MIKIALTNGVNKFAWMCRKYSAREQLIHAMPLNTDRPTNRAMVVGCVISDTRNPLKLQMPQTLNPLLSNIHTKTQKLWNGFAIRVTAFRPAARLPCMPTGTLPRAAVAPAIEIAVDTCNLDSARCQSTPNSPRLRALALFGRRRHQRWASPALSASENLTSALQRTASYSTTSSAMASSVFGTVRPSAFAVLRLMISSNLVGCSTGMSLGFVPRSILSTKSAARRKRAG
jgi:hypothetical protein